jgi:hypothetical protein
MQNVSQCSQEFSREYIQLNSVKNCPFAIAVVVLLQLTSQETVRRDRKGRVFMQRNRSMHPYDRPRMNCGLSRASPSRTALIVATQS